MATQSTHVPVLSAAAFLKRLLAGIALLNAFVLILAVLWLDHARQQDIDTAKTTTQNLAKVLEQYIAGTFANIDLALVAVADEYARHGRNTNVDALLAEHLSRQPPLVSLRMTDAQGMVRYGAGIAAGSSVSIADRDYFIAARDGDGLAISKPLQSRISGKWIITLARRVDEPSGAFAGVVYASLALEHLAQTFASLDVGPRGSVTLRDADLGIVARHPEPNGPGSTIGNKTVARELRTMVDAGQREGSFAGTGNDDVERVSSFRRLRGYPFYVTVGTAHDDFLSVWREQAAYGVVLAALFLLVTAAATRLLVAAWKRQLAAAEALMRQETKFHILADFTYDWAYWQSADLREIVYMTPSCERITGYAAAEFATDPELLLRIVHPEDRAAMEEHLAKYGGHSEEAIDFRILHRDGSIRWIAHACRPIFAPDGTFLGRRVGNRDISERKRTEEMDRRLHASLRGLSEITALSHLPLSEQLQGALAVGAAHFGLEVGIVSRIDGERYEIVAQVSPPGMLTTGQVFRTGVTYCSLTLAERRVVAITHMGVSGYVGHPCYREFNLETYIGAPIFVGNEIFGTVNFSSAKPYEQIFDDGDREFIALFARWAGSAIARGRAEDALRQSEARLREAQRIAQIGSWELDLAARTIRCSDETFRIFEVDPQGFAASYAVFFDAIHADDKDTVDRAFREAMRNKRPFDIVHRLQLPDSQIKYVHERGEFTFDADGTALRAAGTAQDVTLRVLADESLRESEERFRTIADYTYDWEYWQGPQGEFLYVSPSCQRVTGYAQAEFIARPRLVYDIIHAEDRSLMDDHIADIRHEDEGTLDFRIVAKDGGIRWIAHGCRAVFARDGRFLGRRASNRDITDRKHAEEQVQQLAYYDTLTGLPNRRMLLDRINHALAQAKRFGRSLAVMFLDLDKFKQINDTLGHEVGDELLKQAAARLASCVRSVDTVSRQGGDEFVVVLSEIAEPKDAARVAEKILAALREPILVGAETLRITTSIGIAVYPVNGSDDVRELLKKADQAMYAAKEAGRDRYGFFTEGAAP